MTEESQNNKIFNRPWGIFEVIAAAKNHKVKKLTVYPKEKLSLQSHNFRSEHWVVVQGEAKVINGENEIRLSKNECTFIPSGSKHRLDNTGEENLEIIEVQIGSYFEEDDIVRYDDLYNRV